MLALISIHHSSSALFVESQPVHTSSNPAAVPGGGSVRWCDFTMARCRRVTLWNKLSFLSSLRSRQPGHACVSPDRECDIHRPVSGAKGAVLWAAYRWLHLWSQYPVVLVITSQTFNSEHCTHRKTHDSTYKHLLNVHLFATCYFKFC